LEEFDPESNTLTRLADLKPERWDVSMVACNNRLYVIGGGNETSSWIDEYNTETNNWSRVKNLPFRYNAQAIANGNKIFISGGILSNMKSFKVITINNSTSAPVIKDRKLVYPNPANNNLQLGSIGNYQQLEIINEMGRVVKKFQSHENKNTVNISDLKSGTYFIKIDNQQVQKTIINNH
jgi:hypothetical protein